MASLSSPVFAQVATLSQGGRRGVEMKSKQRPCLKEGAEPEGAYIISHSPLVSSHMARPTHKKLGDWGGVGTISDL